jgi:hypothetical protein
MHAGTKTKCGICNKFVLPDDIIAEKVVDDTKVQVCKGCVNGVEISTTSENLPINNPLDNLPALRKLLLNTMKIKDKPEQEVVIKAQQALDVQLSPAVLSKGTQNFYQIQNVSVQVTNNLVDCVEMVLDLEDHLRNKLIQEQKPMTQVIDVTKPEISLETITDSIEWLSNKDLSLKEFENLMKGLFSQAMIAKTGSTKEAAKLMGCSQSSASVYSRGLDDVLDKVSDKQLEVL